MIALELQYYKVGLKKQIIKVNKTINNSLSYIKYNIYKERQQFLQDHSDDNICDRKEDKENYLNIDAVTESRAKGKTDSEVISIMRNNSTKLQVRLWKYKSNPGLKDTDFDGLDDNIDKVPKDNYFTGRMHTTRISGDNAKEVDRMGLRINKLMCLRALTVIILREPT